MSEFPINLTFGDAKYDFLFLADEWRELQRVTNVGPWELESRMVSNRCLYADIRETIRVGLIGGGMKPGNAVGLVDAHIGVKPGDLEAGRLVAIAAISHSLHGLDEDVAGES
jgi:hypothetical protein